MIGIAESGSTKTNWVFFHGENKYQYITEGINPYYQSSEEIYLDIKKNLLSKIDFHEAPEVLYFYGAGILTKSKKEVVEKGLKRVFPYTDHNIYSDLLGAARSLFGKEEGIACVCGTGSNSGYYNGEELLESVPSLGLYLGDEGSGGNLGRILVKHYLRNSLPDHLRNSFENMFSDRDEEIMDKVYKKPFPNRYLASFAPFLAENQDDPFVRGIVKDNFRGFFENCIHRYEYYKEVKVSFTGSIALFFVNILKEVASETGVQLDKVVGDPLEELLKYHKPDLS